MGRHLLRQKKDSWGLELVKCHKGMSSVSVPVVHCYVSMEFLRPMRSLETKTVMSKF